MKPDLEVVHVAPGESFAAWSHGYPFRTVRWHFHPEYEIHLITETSGRCFVGDHIGDFAPGNLVLTGPNLPHNWVSDVPEGQSVPVRGRIIQFGEAFVEKLDALLPEWEEVRALLADSARGLEFPPQTAAEIAPLMRCLMTATGLLRIELFMRILRVLARAPGRRHLASAHYLPDPSGYMSAGINKALDFIRCNLTERFSETDLARIAGKSPSHFSREFRRHTGMTLVQYVNRLRINLACQLLSDPACTVTDACFEAGFNNLSNFNRQFLSQKGMPPSRFRALLWENAPLTDA